MAKDNDNIVHVDYKKFKEICFANWEYFEQLPNAQVFESKTGKKYIYIDNGSKVLGVAHLDSVQTKDYHFHVLEIAKEVWVYNAQLDDRIGAYALLDLLPRMGLTYDILLTDEEESGKSTAQFFETEKQYNWMFQFDRRGEDVVHYMYNTEFLKKRLTRAGFKKIQEGMKSDIWYLDFLKCCGFNVGVGYENEHSVWARADMNVFVRQVNRFADFYNKFKDLYFKYEKKKYVYTYPTTTYSSDVLPVGYSHAWFEGAVWDYTYRAWKPKPVSKEPVTSLVPKDTCPAKCEKCEVNMNWKNRGLKINRLCKVCEPKYFVCIGCDDVCEAGDMKEMNLCTSCNERRLIEGDNKFITLAECETSRCFTPLTWAEYRRGLYCTHCEDLYDGMFMQ